MKAVFIMIVAAMAVGMGLFFVWGALFRKDAPRQPASHRPEPKAMEGGDDMIRLTPPRLKGIVSVEEAIKARRSRREFSDKSLTLAELSQVCWAAQGITKGYLRAAPSAGALYPLELYVIVGKDGVKGLGEGVYHYLPQEHSLRLHAPKDRRMSLAMAALGQTFIARAPVSLVITAQYSRTTGKYGARGRRYVHMEVGHVGENIHLQAEALHMATVVIGAFSDAAVVKALNLPAAHEPLAIMPVGYPKRE